jgi:hypothetical protein
MVLPKQIVTLILENEEDLEAALREVRQQIVRLEIQLEATEKALQAARSQEQALLQYKGKM